MKHASPKTCSYDVQVLLLKGAGVNHGQVADWYIPIPASIQPAIYTHAILPTQYGRWVSVEYTVHTQIIYDS